MPSLSALEQFKTSFLSVGGEDRILAEKNLSPEDFALPDNEPVIREKPAAPLEAPLPEPETFPDASDNAGAPEDFSGDVADFDFEDFLRAGGDALSTPVPDIPDDLGEETAAAADAAPDSGLPADPVGDLENDFSGGESPDVHPPGAEPLVEDASLSADDFNLPDDLLNGLVDDLDQPAPEESFPETDENAGIAADETNIGDETFPPEEEPIDPSGSTDSGESISADEAAEESINPEEQVTSEEPVDSKESIDPFDGFDMTADAGVNLDDSGSGDMGDFDLDGLDDVLKRAMPGAAGEKPVPDRFGAAAAEAADEVEEITLTEAELKDLQSTLASYPLNLRIICEELIAEQAVAPNLMSRLVRLLVEGASARETAALAGKILGRSVPIPRGFEKKTGAALEAEQSSFGWMFAHNFLPTLRIFSLAGAAAASLFYLVWQFIYLPIHAESIYKTGYERIAAGEYGRAVERFQEAFSVRKVKGWFYKYAEAFRDERQNILAEEKYEELLYWYPRDKKGVLDYANLETYYQFNYEKADSLLRLNILDYTVNDYDALLALGDNNMAWAEDKTEAEKAENKARRYENAREAYAKVMEHYGRTDPVLERMLRYFIRTDHLDETLELQMHFMSSEKTKISPATLSEMGGYLLDKRFEDIPGTVPHEYQAQIEGIRDILFRAIKADPEYPESYYHLARYYNHWGNTGEEKISLETAIRNFDASRQESVRRTRYRIDTQRRYAQLLIGNREFIAAEEQLAKGINIYEDIVSRGRMQRDAEFGRLYADMGDLEYFTKEGKMAAALDYYQQAERNFYAPPEMQYRMGSAYYHLEQWVPAMERFIAVSGAMPLNRRLLNALGNTAFKRGDYYLAQGYYSRLLGILEADRVRFPRLSPQEQREHMELVERLMAVQNNMAATFETLAESTGNISYRSRVLGLYAESARTWDSLTRDPETMIRAQAVDFSAPGVGSPPHLNSQNLLNPPPGREPMIFMAIDKDVLEPSVWEDLAPRGNRYSDSIYLYPGGEPVNFN